MISVVIAHDPLRVSVDLDRLKCDILSQIDAEIIVAVDGSKSESRNKASSKAKGEILVFLDDDVRLRKDFFREILTPFKDLSVGIVGGVNLAPPDIKGSSRISAVLMSSPLLWFKSVARYTPRGGVRESNESELIGCCLAVKKKAFDLAGGFPLDIIPGEEIVLIQKIQNLGWNVLYNPFAIVYHQRPSFPGGYVKKIFDYGTGRGIMMRKNLFGGFPRSLWKPSWNWIFYFMGFWIHHMSYLGGIFYGYFIKRKYKEIDEK